LRDDEVSYWADDAADQVRGFYLDEGYFQCEVKARVERRDPTKKTWVVTVEISEGPRYRFGVVGLRVDGDSAALPEGVSLEARENRPYRREHIVADLRSLVRTYGNTGFVRAEAEDEAALRDSIARVDVVYRVDRGRAVIFDSLVVLVRRGTANKTLSGLTRESTLRSLVPYQRGDTVRIDDNDKVIEKLQSTGLYTAQVIDVSFREGCIKFTQEFRGNRIGC
jgi:outer membrane protein assembly factor BamA